MAEGRTPLPAQRPAQIARRSFLGKQYKPTGGRRKARDLSGGAGRPPQRVTSTSDSACKDGLAGGGSCRGGTRRVCGCRWKHFDRRPMWTQIWSQKLQPRSKFGAEKCEFCDPSLVPRIRSPFLGPRIMRTIKGEAGIRAADRGRFPAKKPIFGHKFEGRRRKNEQKVTAVSRPQLHRVPPNGQIVQPSRGNPE